MDLSLIAAIVGIFSGAVGYWIATFWMQPILRFRSIRNRVHSDFIYYGQVVNAQGLNDDMQHLYRERILANRKSAAELSSAHLELPCWYLLWLQRRKIDPTQAARHLIGYSNTTDYEDAYKEQNAVRQLLGLPPQI